MADVLLDRPHPGHLAKVGERPDPVGEIDGVGPVGGVASAIRSARSFSPSSISNFADVGDPDVVAVFALVEVLRGLLKRAEPLLQGDVVQRLDVEVDAEVFAVQDRRRRSPSGGGDAGGAKRFVGEDLVDHRGVLDHVVERHLLQAEELLAVDELVELDLEGGLFGQVAERPVPALEADPDDDRRRESPLSPGLPFVESEKVAAHVLVRVRLPARRSPPDRGQVDHVDRVRRYSGAAASPLGSAPRGGDGEAGQSSAQQSARSRNRESAASCPINPGRTPSFNRRRPRPGPTRRAWAGREPNLIR